MKLIHTTNLRLDARMDPSLTQEQARTRRADLLRSFSKLMAYARENAVDAVLVVGGLFDPARASRATVASALDAISDSPGVSVLWVRTPEEAVAFGGLDRPPNLAVFGRDWLRLVIGGVALTCLEMALPNCEFCYGDLYCASDMPNVVALRGAPGQRPGPGVVSLPDLVGKGISYLALGGDGARMMGALERGVDWVQPGSLEGISFSEPGDHGFTLVEIDERGRVSHAPVPLARRRHLVVPVSAAEAPSPEGLAHVMEHAAAQAGAKRRDLVRFVVNDVNPLDGTFRPRMLLERLQGRYFYVEVEPGTLQELTPSDYELDVSLRGEFIRTVLSCDLPAGETARVLRAGLAALEGGEVAL